MQEGLTWAFVALATAAYLRQPTRGKPAPTNRAVTLSAQDEIAPTRWSHNGTQPPHYGSFDGNKVHQKQAAVMDLRDVLGF